MNRHPRDPTDDQPANGAPPDSGRCTSPVATLARDTYVRYALAHDRDDPLGLSHRRRHATHRLVIYARIPVVAHIVEPAVEQILRYCAEDPVERVFLEDVARRRLGRFAGLEEDGRLVALCHTGANVVPSGRGCAAFADVAARARARMLIGEEGAVSDLWEAVRRKLPAPREDRPGQPVYTTSDVPDPGTSGLRPARLADLDLLVPACAQAHKVELGIDPLARDADGFRWRTRTQIVEGRSWLWAEDGVILFKAEASAWTPAAVQLQQVWTDPAARGAGNGGRGLRDLIRLLLAEVPRVCLFVRADNEAAIALYDSVGMQHVLDYRSVLL